MPTSPRADEWDEDPINDALTGTAGTTSPAPADSPAAEHLLQMAGFATQLELLLDEASAGEFAYLKPRLVNVLETFNRIATKALQRSPGIPKAVGFKAPK